MAISPREVVRSTSCLVLGWGFLGRRIEWRYFRFRQIQSGDAAAILKNSNRDISAADHPIYSALGSRIGFSGSADRMALFPVSPNLRWRLRLLCLFLCFFVSEITSKRLDRFAWNFQGSCDRVTRGRPDHLIKFRVNLGKWVGGSNVNLLSPDIAIWFDCLLKSCAAI